MLENASSISHTELNREIAEFFKRGGQVTVLPPQPEPPSRAVGLSEWDEVCENLLEAFNFIN